MRGAWRRSRRAAAGSALPHEVRPWRRGYPADVPYLVLFVADPAEDRHADALRDVARSVAGAGFFDGGEAGDARTVGTYVQAAALDEPGAQALLAAMAEFAVRAGA